MTVMMPLVSINASSEAMTDIGPDGNEYEDPDDYTHVAPFDISRNYATPLAEQVQRYVDDPLYDITGDGSVEDPFVVKDLWFEGSRTWWYGVLYNWVFIHCVFESSVVMYYNSGSSDLLSFDNCTFYSVYVTSRGPAGLQLQYGSVHDIIFTNNTIINIDPFTGTVVNGASGVEILSTSATNILMENNFIDGGINIKNGATSIVRNNTCSLESLIKGTYSGTILIEMAHDGTQVYNNRAAYISVTSSSTGITVSIHDNILDAQGSRKIEGVINVGGADADSHFYIFNNLISNSTGSGISANSGSEGLLYIFDNHVENTYRGFMSGIDIGGYIMPSLMTIARMDNNTFVRAWSADPVIGFTYDSVVTDTNVPVSWTFRSIVDSGNIAASRISADNGFTWTATDAFDSTIVHLDLEEKVDYFLLDVTDSSDNDFIESFNITLDLSAPQVTFLAPLEGKTLRTEALQVFYETEDLTGVTYAKIKLDDGEWTEGVDLSGHVFEGAEIGAHTITVYVEDILGHGQGYTVNFMFLPSGEVSVSPYSNILIDGDEELYYFIQFNGFDGSGTESDPYIINGLNIDCDGGTGISIINTTDRLILYDIEFFDGNLGLCLINATNIFVESCIFHDGIDEGTIVNSSQKVSIIDCLFENTNVAICITTSDLINIDDCLFSFSKFGVCVNDSVGTITLAGNIFLDCLFGISTGVLDGVLILRSNNFERCLNAMDLLVDNNVLNVLDNDVKSSIYAFNITSSASSLSNISGNSASNCIRPLTCNYDPLEFWNNTFILNEESNMLWFTSPVDGYVTGSTAISCDFAYSAIGGAGFAQFSVSNDMISWGMADSSSNNAYDLLVEGDNVLYLRGTDYRNNSITISIIVNRDTTVPTLSISLPQIDLVLRTTSLPIIWTASDVNDIVIAEVNLDGNPWVPADYLNGHTFNGITEGTHTLHVRVIDGVGLQTEASASFKVVLDGSAAALTNVVIVGDDSLIENATLLGWSGDGSAIDPFVVKWFSTSLSLTNTNLHVVLRGLTNIGNITLRNVENFNIENVVMRNKTITVDGFKDLSIDKLDLYDTTIGTYRFGLAIVISNGEGLTIKESKIYYRYTAMGASYYRYIRDAANIANVNGALITGNSFISSGPAVGYIYRAIYFQGSDAVIDDNSFSTWMGGAICAEGTNIMVSNNSALNCGASTYSRDSGGSVYISRMIAAMTVNGSSNIVYNNSLVRSAFAYSTTVKGGPGLIVTGSAIVCWNNVTEFQVNTFEGIGVIVRNNTFTSCFIGMNGTATMIGNKVTGTNGIVPTRGAYIEDNVITVTDNAFYSAFYTPRLSTLNFADNVTIKGNIITAKVAFNLDDGNADFDSIYGLKIQRNSVTASVAAIRMVTAVLSSSEVSGNLFACITAGMLFSYAGTSTNGVDFRGNTFSSVISDAIISFARPSGAVTPGTMMHLYFNGTLLGGLSAEDCRLSVDGSSWTTVSKGGWFLLDPDFFPEGAFNLRCLLEDGKGNVFVASVDIVYDSESPIIDILSPDEEEINPLGDISIAWTVSDQGTGQVNQVRMMIDDGNWMIVTGETERTFTSLADGTHIVLIEAIDDQGHVAIAERTFVIDALAPEVTILSPSDHSVIASTDLTLRFDADDAASGVAQVSIRIDGGSWTIITGDEYVFSGLSDGAHTITVRAFDAVGWSGTDTVTITVDTTAPSLTISSPSFGEALSDGSVDVAYGTGDAIMVKMSVDGGSWTTVASGPVSLDLADGTHTVAMRAYDSVGNMNETAVTFLVDTIAPQVALLYPENGATITTSTLDIYFSATDASGIQSLSLHVNGERMDVSGSNIYRMTDLTDGEYAVSLNATDLVGMFSLCSVTFTIDLDDVLPALSFIGPVDGSVVATSDLDVSFAADDPSGILSLAMTVDGETIDVLGLTSYALAGLSDGDHILTLVATDGRGNEASCSMTITVDTTAPSLTISSPSFGEALSDGSVDVAYGTGDRGQRPGVPGSGRRNPYRGDEGVRLRRKHERDGRHVPGGHHRPGRRTAEPGQ
jgi:hypothetical protein